MSGLYYWIVTIHVLAAIIWLGGMIFFALVAPILRQIDDEAFRARLFERLGRRFRVVGWICITVLVVTGIEQLRMRGWWGASVWGAPGFWGTALGGALAGKVGLVVFMLAVQSAHDFWLGPAAGKATPGSDGARALRRKAAWLARVNAIAGLVLVYYAVRLGRGG